MWFKRDAKQFKCRSCERVFSNDLMSGSAPEWCCFCALTWHKRRFIEDRIDDAWERNR